MGQAACVSLLPWMTEPLSALSRSLTDDRVWPIYAVFHWRMWIHGTRHLWTSGRCHSQYYLADHEWRNKTSVSEPYFVTLHSTSGTLPTICCANPQPLGTCVPWKEPQSLRAMDLLYILTDGVPLLVHVDLPEMNDSVLPSSLDPYPWMATTHNSSFAKCQGVSRVILPSTWNNVLLIQWLLFPTGYIHLRKTVHVFTCRMASILRLCSSLATVATYTTTLVA